MKIIAEIFLVVLIGLSVVVYLGYGIAVLLTHQTLPQTIVPLLFGAVVLAAVIWGSASPFCLRAGETIQAATFGVPRMGSTLIQRAQMRSQGFDVAVVLRKHRNKLIAFRKR